MDPLVFAGIVLTAVFLLLVSVAGPGGYFVVFAVLKIVLGYGWKLFYPLWIVLRQRGPYKAAAIGLAFTNFWVQLYTFMQTTESGALKLAFDALAAAIVGGFRQVTSAGYIMISNPTDPVIIVKSLILMVLGLSSIMLWYMGWRMLKRKVPELTYYILVTVLAVALAWGMNELDAVFEVFDMVKVAADTAAGNETVNQTVNQTASKSVENLSIFE